MSGSKRNLFEVEDFDLSVGRRELSEVQKEILKMSGLKDLNTFASIPFQVSTRHHQSKLPEAQREELATVQTKGLAERAAPYPGTGLEITQK